MPEPSSAYHSGTNPNLMPTPSKQFFAEALHDKDKEVVAIEFLKSRCNPAFLMIREIGSTMSMDLPEVENDLIRVLMQSAVTNPSAFNHEYREVVEGNQPIV